MVNVTHVDEVVSRVIHFFFPSVGRESKKLAARSSNIDITIQSYSEMSFKLQKEVDENHFAPFLLYEKKNIK